MGGIEQKRWAYVGIGGHSGHTGRLDQKNVGKCGQNGRMLQKVNVLFDVLILQNMLISLNVYR